MYTVLFNFSFVFEEKMEKLEKINEVLGKKTKEKNLMK